MEREHVDAYLARIGVDRPVRADAETLRELQVRHLLAVPFENLSIHLGEPVDLDEKALIDKLVHRQRGGFCYEVNAAFAGLLTALGYRVTMLAAKVHGESGFGPPFDHLALRVDLAEPWLVDVGFGRFSHHPLRLDTAERQPDPGGTFRLSAEDHGETIVWCGDEPQYLLEPRPRELVDFEPTCWWHQTSPKSTFTRSVVCSRLTPTGRVTVRGRVLLVTTGETHKERLLTGDADTLATYRDHFGIVLDRVPVVADRRAGAGVPS